MRCNIRVSGESCPDVPVYLVFLEDCEVCQVRLFLSRCGGHRICVAHAAEARLSFYQFCGAGLPGGNLEVERIRSLALG